MTEQHEKYKSWTIIAILSIIVVAILLYMILKPEDKHTSHTPPTPSDSTHPNPQAGLTKASLIRKSMTVIGEGKSRTIGYYFYRPKGYGDPAHKYPVIIYLHGIGERGFNGTTGTDVSTVSAILRQPIPKWLPRASMTFTDPTTRRPESFVVLAPQLSKEFGNWRNFYTEEMLKYIKKSLMPYADTNRIYLTGLSLGGGGVWDALQVDAIAKQFAAAAPICGTCRLSSVDAIVKNNIPIWMFHANDDPTVSVSCTNSAYLKILKVNPTHDVEKTIYATGGHGIWTRAYDTLHKTYILVGNEPGTQNPNLYEWFLQYSKKRLRGWNEWEEPEDPNELPWPFPLPK